MTERSDPEVATGPLGERAHRSLIDHTRTFEKRLCRVTDRVFCVVGCGLANSTMVVGDGGAIVVDTGDGLEEAREHLEAFRTVTDAPVRAVIYSHFHYVDGTRVYVPEGTEQDVELWAHARVPANMASRFGETGPAWVRRVLVQFGAFLPKEGEDAMPNFGIGPYMFHPKHGRGTPGYVPPNRLVSETTRTEILGVRVEMIPARSDSDDTLILHFPDERTVVNNHVWPALYNVYPLRGEPYRDPLVILEGLDAIADLEPEHLVGVHGPPLSGRDTVARALEEYRDAVQYLWDQTVRGINRGLGPRDIAETVRLPAHLENGTLTRQHYGLVRHHVRQIYGGLFGWFDGDCADLFAVAPATRGARIVEGFGGRAAVCARARASLEAGDAAWAAELATYALQHTPGDAEAKALKAAALRWLAQRTTGANARAFCLTQALELEGKIMSPWALSLGATEADVLRAPPGRFVAALRVELDPERSADADEVAAFHFTDVDTTVSLHVRRGVAVYREGTPRRAGFTLRMTTKAWARLYTNQTTLRRAVERGEVTMDAPVAEAEAFFARFDRTFA